MDYPSNSQKSKEEPSEEKDPKKVEKVISGRVVRRKKPVGRKFSEVFFGGTAKDVWSFVVADVLIPAAKDMISDSFSQGIDRMLYGDRAPGGRSKSKMAGYVNYSRPAARRTYEDPRPAMTRKGRATHNFDEIILDSRGEAEEVIDRLFDLTSRYEVATVADLYELVGISGSYTDDKWGWMDLRGASVSRVRSGYLLDLPRPEPID